MKTAANTNSCINGTSQETRRIMDEGLTTALATALVGYVVMVATKPTASLRELETMRDIAGLLIYGGACGSIRHFNAGDMERMTKDALHLIDVLFSSDAKKEANHDENHR